MKYLVLSPHGQGEVMLSDEQLGRGGEGSVFRVESHNIEGLLWPEELVAKLYHEPNSGERQAKVRAMVQAPPATTSIAWPLALVFRQDRTFVGFLMRRLHAAAYRPWAELAHAGQRRQTAQTFDLRYAITAVRNLAVAMAAVHQAGHRIGDVNESNIFVGADASVLLVDSDSAQVRSPEGKVFPCLVGKPEYTAPELQGASLGSQERTEATDVFALAVAAYQMLTGGAHPTDATWTGAEEPPSVGQKLRRGVYPGLGRTEPGLAHPARIPAEALPSRLRALLLHLLSPRPEGRAGITVAIAALDELLPHLKQCERVQAHWYDGRDGGCGWCAHAAKGQPDPWAPKSASEQNLPKQFVLPSVQFGDSQGEPVVRRAPARRAGPSRPPQASHGQGQAGPSSYPASSQPSGAPQPPTPGQQGSAPPPQKKGGRTILNYADGTQGPRPPMGVLMRVNPKLAISCAKDETPEVARFWWSTSRPVARREGVLLGLLLGVLLATFWGTQLPTILESFSDASWSKPLFSLAALVAAAGVGLSSFLLTVSALRDRSRELKRAGGDPARLRWENLPKTVLRYLGLGLVYGPFLVAGIVGGVLLLGLNLLTGLIDNSSRSYR